VEGLDHEVEVETAQRDVHAAALRVHVGRVAGQRLVQLRIVEAHVEVVGRIVDEELEVHVDGLAGGEGEAVERIGAVVADAPSMKKR
jgi:hypothetical protein